ncbi:MAG: polysaccharide deacetylase family protein, partial [Ignavibacteriaceae bacterium]
LFFCVGDNVRRYSSLAKGIFEEQHALGNHAYHHQRVTRLSKKGLKDEIEMTNRIIEEVCGMHPNYFRPPHGRFTFHLAATLKEFKMKNVMWSLLTYDYKNDEKVVKFAIKNYLTKNAIVVFHDSDKSASLICDAIKYVADEAARKYFQFGTPEECLS